MKTKNLNYLEITPYFLCTVFVLYPILNLSQDLWDGSIIEYASMLNNFLGLETYFFETNWLLQYGLSIFVINLSNLLDFTYKNTNLIFQTPSSLLIREISY